MEASMEFRPCIDLHNGQVKQIVGSSLADQNDEAVENFVAAADAAYYAKLYQEKGLKGGHIILLNPESSSYYEQTKAQAVSALGAYRGGLQVGGGIHAENAAFFLEAGASHVIVTSYVFYGGHIHMERLEKLCRTVGREHLVLDLSCRKRGDAYYIVTDRWQNFTEEKVDSHTLNLLAGFCDEFLIHAVDVEGKNQGIEEALVRQLGAWSQSGEGLSKIPITYAGGVHSYEDIGLLRTLGGGRIHVTVGSALEIFGGSLLLEEVIRRCAE
jgi:phosphoribosylformimino-5-aminoimidazole carboxamide ribotide isomerase